MYKDCTCREIRLLEDRLHMSNQVYYVSSFLRMLVFTKFMQSSIHVHHHYLRQLKYLKVMTNEKNKSSTRDKNTKKLD